MNVARPNRRDRPRFDRRHAVSMAVSVPLGGRGAAALRTESMAEALLDGISGCVFDAYGTLFNFGSAAAGCRDVLGDKAAPLTALWRDKQLQYTWLRAVQGRHADFWQVTGDALRSEE